MDFETTQRLVDAIEQCLIPYFEQSPAQFELTSNFDLENFVSQVIALVPQARPETVIAYLQLYLTPMGEGEDDFFMGEDIDDEGYHGVNPFHFDMTTMQNALSNVDEGAESEDESEAPQLIQKKYKNQNNTILLFFFF